MNEDSITPIPRLKLLITCVIVFSNTFSMTMLLPFLTFMVEDFKVAPNPDDIGYYSGFLVGSFMLGQLLSSYSYGVLSDKYGRRPMLLTGLFLTSFSFLAFGFVRTYTMAIIVRLLGGVFNGIMAVVKTYLSEVTDSSNQAKAFSLFGVARGAGMLCGPIVGGYLSRPSDNFPTLFPPGSIFHSFPYALPCIIGFLITFSGFIVGYFVLEETNQSVIAKSLDRHSGRWNPFRLNSLHNLHQLEREESVSLLIPPTANIPAPKTIMEMLQERRVIVSLILYTSLSFTYIQFDELFALWARLSKAEGGLAFTPEDLGTAYAIGGIALFLFQIFLFAPFEQALGTLKTFQYSLLLSLPAFLLLPLASNFENPIIIWIILTISQILRSCFGVSAFTSTFIMITNSSTAENRGSLNGFGQTMGSIGRMLGPVTCGILFSWSIENHLAFPFDFHFVFILLAIIVFSTYCASLFMPESINYRISEDTE